MNDWNMSDSIVGSIFSWLNTVSEGGRFIPRALRHPNSARTLSGGMIGWESEDINPAYAVVRQEY